LKTNRFWWRIACLALAAILLPLSGAASESGARPGLLMLRVAGEGASRELEERFLTELKLALDSFEVWGSDWEDGDFEGLPLDERLTRIRQVAQKTGAKGTLWIDDREGQTISLNIVVLTEGRAVVRIIEEPAARGAEKELAFAARELLEEVYFVDTSSTTSSEPDGESAGAGDGAGVAEPLEVGIGAFFATTGGALGHEGPSSRLGGGVQVEVRLDGSWFFRVGAAALAGPSGLVTGGEVSGWGLEMTVTAGHDWRVGPFLFGPFLELGTALNKIDVDYDQGDSLASSSWGFLGTLGLDLRWVIVDALHLIADPYLSTNLPRDTVERSGDGAVPVAGAYLGWGVDVGLAVFF